MTAEVRIINSFLKHKKEMLGAEFAYANLNYLELHKIFLLFNLLTIDDAISIT